MALADINLETLKETQEWVLNDYPDVQVISLPVDVRSASEVDEMVSKAATQLGALHYCVNCFGISTPSASPSLEIKVEAFKTVTEINQRGTWLCLRAQIRQALTQERHPFGPGSSRASIVNVTSVLGLAAEPGSVMATSSSHGIVGMTRAAALDSISQGIRLNCVCAGSTESGYLKMSSALPTGVPVTPMEIAYATAFLLSHEAESVNAVAFRVDRGWSLYHS